MHSPFELLLDYCYNLNWADEFGRTAAIEAASVSEMKMARYLLEQGLTHDLLDFAWYVENNKANPLEEAEYREKLLRLLHEKHGINFPVPSRQPTGADPSPSPPVYARSCLER